MEFGRVEWMTDRGHRGTVSYLTVPVPELPFDAIQYAFVLFGNRPPSDPDTNVLLLAADHDAMRLFLVGVGNGRFKPLPVAGTN